MVYLNHVNKSLNEDSELELISLIENLNKKLEELKINKRKLKEDMQKAVNELKHAKTLLKQKFEEVGNLKSERNKINVEIRNYKSRRGFIRQQQRSIIQQIKDLKCKIATLKRQAVVPEVRITKRLERLKWTYETNPVNPKAERKIINEINKLEFMAEVHNKIRDLQIRIVELRRQYSDLNDEANKIHELIFKLSQQSQHLQESLKSKYEEVNMLRARLQDRSNEIKSLILQLNKTNDEIRCIVSRLHELKSGLTCIHTYRNLIKTARIKENIVKEILNKIKRGEKLSFDEFKIALELNMFENS